MLDKRTNKLLNALARICEDGNYKVIEITELLNVASGKFAVGDEALDAMVKFLIEKEMVDIKYQDDEVYCIAVLPKGRNYVETAHIRKRSARDNRFITTVALVSFFAGFFGAFLAGLISSLI